MTIFWCFAVGSLIYFGLATFSFHTGGRWSYKVFIALGSLVLVYKYLSSTSVAMVLAESICPSSRSLDFVTW